MTLAEPDSLYRLLPAVHRIRDAGEGEPLRALLQVIAEQVRALHAATGRLYDSWFIETCDAWLAPYVADLVGYRRVGDAGEPGDAADPRGGLRNRILFPRREIANTVRLRRRKGTLPVLEELARHAAEWSARAVEFAPLVVRTQQTRSPRPGEGGSVCVRSGPELAGLGTPFDTIPRTADLRAIQSAASIGWHGMANVLLFVWRRKAERVRESRPSCIPGSGEKDSRHFTFDVLGRRLPLHVNPVGESSSDSIAERRHVPVPLTRRMLDDDGHASAEYYGPGEASLAVYRNGHPIRADQVLVRDLSSKAARHRAHHDLCALSAELAVDPECGLFLDRDESRTAADYRVTFHAGVAGTIGAGELPRKRSGVETSRVHWPRSPDPPGRQREVLDDETVKSLSPRVQWIDAQGPDRRLRVDEDLTVELRGSDSYVLTTGKVLEIAEEKTLVVRAGRRSRPVIEVPQGHDDCGPVWRIILHPRSRIVLEGLLIDASVSIEGAPQREDDWDPPTSHSSRAQAPGPQPDGCPCDGDSDGTGDDSARIVVRHCTILPGHGGCGCPGEHRFSDAIAVRLAHARLCIRSSLLGPIDIRSPGGACCDRRPDEAACPAEHVAVSLEDSILDGGPGTPPGPVLSGGCCRRAHARVSVRRSTLRGDVRVVSLPEAEDSLFLGKIDVERRQEGYVRFCYLGVPEKTRTPVRFKCLPESAGTARSGNCPRPGTAARQPAAGVRPKFVSWDFSHPGYGQLAADCPAEILRGAEDESELGAFHDEFFPQRDSALRGRLQEFTPSDVNSAVIYADDLMPPLGPGPSRRSRQETRS